MRSSKWFNWILIIILIPLVLALIANFTFWLNTKDNVEITFRLDGWITIGSVKFAAVDSLKLMLGSQPVKNILKVSWLIINTGNQGIGKFESGPSIKFPEGLDIFAVEVSETSENLIINRDINLEDSVAQITSIGIFNPTDFFRVDFYLKDVVDNNIKRENFEEWKFKGKALNLNIMKDLSYFKPESTRYMSFLRTFMVGYCICAGLVIFISEILRYMNRRLEMKYRMNREIEEET